MGNNKKINVLMVNYEFPPIGGGGGTTTRFLAKFLVKLGVSVSVLTSTSSNENSYDHPDGFKVYHVGPLKNKLSGTHLPELARFIFTSIYYSRNIKKVIHPDIIHCFFTLPSGCFGLYCKKIFNIPYITSALGADVPGFNIGDKRLDIYHTLTKPVSRSIWDNSSYIVANSKSLKEQCEKFTPYHDIKVITNGVDTEVFFPLKGKSLSEKIRFLFVSRLMPQKGIDTLINACGILKEKGIENFSLTVVGDGHQRPLMEALIKKHDLKEFINHKGWINLEDLPNFYRNADVFVLPSSMEGMPSVALQAMASGLPIIASRVEGFEEILEENINGLYFEYKNENALADHMADLINNPSRIEKLSKESLRKSKDFSWEKIASDYLDLYETSLNFSQS
jgi:glycosyltransferase involved in cell wall biosynthesis